ncbi:hypothetical protein ACFQPA_19280 [Halomarina halobia]|uniref:Uncharacterized protein n=1 Tax=Halomarina halobia TaxID=3033386 RepID=A0ABD6AD04_9EURY|nr:hypothetical protein [Halomarina sp. PSR21]
MFGHTDDGDGNRGGWSTNVEQWSRTPKTVEEFGLLTIGTGA